MVIYVTVMIFRMLKFESIFELNMLIYFFKASRARCTVGEISDAMEKVIWIVRLIYVSLD